MFVKNFWKSHKWFRRSVWAVICMLCFLGCLMLIQIMAWLIPVQLGDRGEPVHRGIVPQGKRLAVVVVGGIWTSQLANTETFYYFRRRLNASVYSPSQTNHTCEMTGIGLRTRGFLPDLKRAAVGLMKLRVGSVQDVDAQRAAQVREAVDQALAKKHEVIVVGLSYGAVVSAIALHDVKSSHVAFLALGSPINPKSLSGLAGVIDVCVGADWVCAIRGPSANSFGLNGPPTPGLRLGDQHSPVGYFDREYAGNTTMKALTELVTTLYPRS